MHYGSHNMAPPIPTDGDEHSVILEEQIDPNYKPTQQEILEYARFLGMDPVEDKKYFYIAEEGLKAPLPS